MAQTSNDVACAVMTKLQLADPAIERCKTVVSMLRTNPIYVTSDTARRISIPRLPPDGLPIAILWSERIECRPVDFCLFHDHDVSMKFSIPMEGLQPKVEVVRRADHPHNGWLDGTWREALLTGIVLNLRRFYPGSWKLIDVSRAAARNAKHARQAGYLVPNLRGVDFFELDPTRISQVINHMEAHTVKRAPRIAVIGGDGRVERAAWPDDIDVTTYTGMPENANRIIESFNAGKLDRCVVLTRWMSHSIWDTLRKGPIPVSAWPYGIPRLAKEMHEFLGLERDVAPGAPPPAPPDNHESKLWRDVVLVACKDFGDVINADQMTELLGVPADYADVLEEALVFHVERGALLSCDRGFRVAPPPPGTTPPLPAPPPARLVPVPAVPPVPPPAAPFAAAQMAMDATGFAARAAAGYDDPSHEGRMEPSTLAELGGRWASQLAKLTKLRRRQAALRAELEELGAEVDLVAEDVEITHAEVVRLSEEAD